MVLAILLLPLRARADEETFSWARSDGGEKCPSTEVMRARIAERLGSKKDAQGRSIDAIVSRTNGRYTARVLLRDATGTLRGAREITSDAADCDPLAAAVVLAAALAIDPESASRPSPSQSPSPSPSPSPPSPPAPAPPLDVPVPVPVPVTDPSSAGPPSGKPSPSPSPSTSTSTSTSTWEETRGAVIARPELSLGLVPHPAFGVAVAGRVRVANRVDVAAGLMWIPEARLADGAFGIGLSAVRLGACVAPWESPPFALLGCADFLAGATHASARDASVAPAGERGWFAMAASSRFAVRVVGPLLLEVGADAIVPFVRDTFVSGRVVPGENHRNAFQQAAVAGLFHFGAGVSF
ncbi:MAG: hypothetical protein JWM74_1872 [Myxococcaceae bacterium]|nr:hypothetical protein [Myxococcaceae bacterium]